MNPTKSRGPLFLAIALLLLPTLYLGSYFALVVPRGIPKQLDSIDPYSYKDLLWSHNRVANDFLEIVFWPLERIDRKLRPDAWDNELPGLGWTSYPPLPLPPANSPGAGS